MAENDQIAIPLYYEIYLQDLSHDYVDLTFIGIARTPQEASNQCKLLREAISSARARGLTDRNYDACTALFRPRLKGVE